MSVTYDADPGRLEVYRPRADGLTGRCVCASTLIHALVGFILVTVHFPAPKPLPQRKYRITEIRLLPRQTRPAEDRPAPKQVVESLSPRDLSLFLNNTAHASSRRRSRHRRHQHHLSPRAAAMAAPALSHEQKPDAPDNNSSSPSHSGPKLAEGLPNLLVRQMAEQQPLDPTHPDTPNLPEPGGAPARKAVEKPKRTAIPGPKPPKPLPVRPVRAVSRQSHPGAGGDNHEPEPAPQPVRIARAERARPLADLLPNTREDSGSKGPAPIAWVPPKPAPSTPDRPADLPAERRGAGKRIAELPGSLFGAGSGVSPGPSRRDAALPEGRPGAASAPGPRHPRAHRGGVQGVPSSSGGDAAGVSPLPASGGVRLTEEDRPGAVRRGSPSGLGDLGGKGTQMATLPSTGPGAPGGGAGAVPGGEGAGGGYGAEGPRAFGGAGRPGRSRRHNRGKTSSTGDGNGGSNPDLGSGIGISSVGPGGGGSDSGSHAGGGRGTKGGIGEGEGSGKRVSRAPLPFDGPGDAARGPGHGAGTGGGTGSRVESGPRSFGTGGKRRFTPEADSGRGKGRGSGRGRDDGDAGGVALPSGGGGDDDPGHDGGSDETDSAFKNGRRKPAGVYVSTTGHFTLPGAIYEGDYRYNSMALRKIMDELNSRTKVKVQLGGQYESIAPGSFRKAPVVVFTGHKAFELTDEQRKVLKAYVDSGGMIWADFSHAAFDQSFSNEMEKIFGKAPTDLSSSHPIYRSFYILHGPPQGDLGGARPFQGISVGDRLGVVITPNRYFSAVSGGLNVSDEVQEGASEAVINIYMYAAGNYRAVKDAGD